MKSSSNYSQQTYLNTKKVYKLLLSTKPFAPWVMHVLLMTSTIGAKLNFVAKFYYTKTTQLLFSRKAERSLDNNMTRLQRPIVDYELEMFTSVGNIKTIVLGISPTELASKVRDDL